jgi:PRC-barrel domain protein
MTSQEQVPEVVGTTAYDRDGDKLGRIGQVYCDDDTNQPNGSR